MRTAKQRTIDLQSYSNKFEPEEWIELKSKGLLVVITEAVEDSLEEAAKECDKLSTPYRPEIGCANDGAVDCAKAIRALKGAARLFP